MTGENRTRIRPALTQDAGGITGIVRELGWFEHINREDHADTALRVEHHLALCQADGRHTVLVAETPQQEIAGYIAAHWLPYLMLPGPEGFVSELFVREAERGRGTGKALLAAVEREARERGCSRLNLLNGRKGESYARGFYRKLGWEERDWIANMILELRGEE